MKMSASAKSKQYENWTRDAEIGGLLGRFIEPGKVRVYIKDTLLKDYARERLSDEKQPLRVCGLNERVAIVERYVKPHGLRVSDGRILCWGKADEWKSILMALYERTFIHPQSIPFAAVLMYADGRFHERRVREIVEMAAHKLSIEKVVWLDS
jgi:hypothetical protein